LKHGYVPDEFGRGIIVPLIRQNFFSLRIVNEWNKLPQDVVEASSVNMFKNRLDRHDKIWAFKAYSYIAHQPQVTSK